MSEVNPIVETGEWNGHEFQIHHDPNAITYFGVYEFDDSQLCTRDFSTQEQAIEAVRDMIYTTIVVERRVTARILGKVEDLVSSIRYKK